MDKIWNLIFKTFRRSRMKKLLQLLNLSETDVLLDVGGHPSTWSWFQQPVVRIDILNVSPIDWKNSCSQSHNIQTFIGNGCKLEFGDGHYDIVFSNSVIEHVGAKDRQRAFASEVRRVGRKLWIQTPAYEFFIEPHYLTPFVHWIPIEIRKKILRNFTVWGWITRPSTQAVDQMVNEIQLLSFGEVKELFPDCEILRERFLFVFTKSYIAMRST